MQRANRILLLTMTALLTTIKTSNSSNSSYIGCYSCNFSSPDVSAFDVCSNPAAHSDKVAICVGLDCIQRIAFCAGTDEECNGSKGITIDRGCINKTDDNSVVKDECNALKHPEGPRLTSECTCKTEKCNGGTEASKSVSLMKSVSPVVLVTTLVFSTRFVSP